MSNFLIMEVIMDYSYMETLVKQAKDGDSASKEELALQFKPFILNLSKKTFIDGYDKMDIINECYSTFSNVGCSISANSSSCVIRMALAETYWSISFSCRYSFTLRKEIKI